jgi:hypothetical protein
MNGSISNIIDGVFKNDKKTRYNKLRLSFLKNSTCSKIFNISMIIKKIEKTLKKHLLKRLIKNLRYVFMSVCFKKFQEIYIYY